MRFTVYARAKVEADSPGGAQEIASLEDVEWEVVSKIRARATATRMVAGLGLGWMLTSPWDVGAADVVGAHLRAFSVVGTLLVSFVGG